MPAAASGDATSYADLVNVALIVASIALGMLVGSSLTQSADRPGRSFARPL